MKLKSGEQLAKKFKRYGGNTTRLVDTAIGGNDSVITGLKFVGPSIASLSTGIGLPISIALASVTLVLSTFSTVFTRKTIKIVDPPSHKKLPHDQIRLLAESKL